MIEIIFIATAVIFALLVGTLISLIELYIRIKRGR